MCHLCEVYDYDTFTLNGPKSHGETVRLYTFYHSHRARLVLCHYHSVELFHLGERRFLMEYVKLAHALLERKSEFVELI